MSTKDYSDKQEKMIAEYLDWHQVSGSGARPHSTGDVESSEWLGECKTHVKPGQKIFFDSSIWKKIAEEALAKFKSPAYFVDDGSQKESRTWVIFNEQMLSSRFNVKAYPLRCSTTIRFAHSELKAITSEMDVYRITLGEYRLMLCTLETFYNMI
jgi:hypothetical protein